jgi:hypothetical protein
MSGLFRFRNNKEIYLPVRRIGVQGAKEILWIFFYHEQAPLLQWIGVIGFRTLWVARIRD